MPVSETVRKLALEVESQLHSLSDGQTATLRILQLIPEYLEKNNLAAWDADFKLSIDDADDEESLNFRAIEMVSELAYENMYVAFSAQDTQKAYNAIVRELGRLNISVSEDMDVSVW